MSTHFEEQKRQQREKALINLERAKEQEQQKIKSGYRFVKKDKTSIFVPPHKVESYLADGWKIDKLIEKIKKKAYEK